ncbi:hypothetical protein MHK_006264 [Candidatus Magnetomorum sp. HK-1]|nr:hypothetical protein MHK_006264 [Candidatus Magnetomorum sp. HK-1]
MKLLEWEVSEDNYQEQINIPKAIRDMAAEEGIGTENKDKVVVRLTNMKTGEEYLNRLSITATHQIYVPTEIQKMLEGAGTIRIRIFG